MTKPRVLVVDDKENFVKLFEKLLGDEAEVVTATDGTRALALLGASSFDVVVSDIRMPGVDGLAVLEETRRLQPETEVILMTAYGSIPMAVEAVKRGAYDYLSKPFDPEEARILIFRAVELKRLREQARNLRSALEETQPLAHLVGNSAAMQRVARLVRRAAEASATVLVTGDSGTGKEVVARAIHAAGPRREHRFVAVNCGAIPETLIESELFGHVRGAFTGAQSDRRGLFEEAAGGTIFLDEIGDLPLALQVKLNRALQEKAIRRVGGNEERPVDVRVIAATNGDLKAAVADGRFREDLYYRLNILPIRLPPLRERRSDIPALVGHFLERHGGGRKVVLTPAALSALVRWDWPGNVRELENAVERALAVCDGARIDLEALPEEITQAAARPPAGGAETLLALSFREVTELARDRAARDYLTALLGAHGGNVAEAAARGGMERESLYRLMRRYGIHAEDFKKA